MKTTTSTAVYSLNYRESKTYAAAALFVVGNILLPQLCHLMPQGGLVWLPIYFFTLVAAYKYGLTAGLLTAVASPVVNSRVAFWAVALAVVAYQGIGMLAEWGMTGSFTAALQDVRLGWPGILMQVFGGFAVMKIFKK